MGCGTVVTKATLPWEFRMRSCFWAVFCVVSLSFAGRTTAAEPTEVRLSERTVIRFASPEEGREAIAKPDAFTAALSKFDLQCRLKTDQELKTADLLKLYADNVTAWPEEEVALVTTAIEFVRGRIADFKIPQPTTILLIRTTGKEEAGAAYCRGPAIVLPANMIRQSEAGLQRLLAHELFHVLSTQNPQLRRDLYALIGFRLVEPITLPAAIRDKAITNPDAPQLDAIIELTLANEERVFAAPILIASVDKYDATAGKSLFAYLQFKLLVVAEKDGQWQAVEQDGGPRLLEPRGLESYAKQIGKNTSYIIHPDEILADNFAHLVMQTAKLPTPEIVANMRERLTK